MEVEAWPRAKKLGQVVAAKLRVVTYDQVQVAGGAAVRWWDRGRDPCTTALLIMAISREVYLMQGRHRDGGSHTRFQCMIMRIVLDSMLQCLRQSTNVVTADAVVSSRPRTPVVHSRSMNICSSMKPKHVPEWWRSGCQQYNILQVPVMKSQKTAIIKELQKGGRNEQ